MINGSCKWTRGKVLGGSSALNYMLYVRINEKDYDRWEAEGSTGRNYDNVLKYFKKSDDMRNDEALTNSPTYHSTGGYLKVDIFDTFQSKKLYEDMIKAMNEAGYDSSPDCNGANQTVYAAIQGAFIDKRRCLLPKDS